MGSFTFRWEHPANEVFVTGTFDDWGKTVKLSKKGDIFEKTVDLPDTNEKIYYKFVVDGNWTTNHTAPIEDDGHYNQNNVLKPEDLKMATEPAQAMADTHIEPLKEQTGSSAAQQSSTTQKAGAQLREGHEDENIPGAFPETPAFESSSYAPDSSTFSVNPLPAIPGGGNPVNLKPGEPVPDASNFTTNTITSGVHDDPELKAQDEKRQRNEKEEPILSVNPIPATVGARNPVIRAPGTGVPPPSEVTSNTVDSTVRLDKESYAKSDAYPSSDGGPPQLHSGVTPSSERAGGMFDLPGITNNMIPESSLPIPGGFEDSGESEPGYTIQSASPQSTTARLAGQVPKEPRGVPEVVTESQKEAHAEPEASASPEAVQEKKGVEQELLKQVPEQPATTDSTKGPSSMSNVSGAVMGGLASVGAAVTGAAYAAKDKAAEATGVGQGENKDKSWTDTIYAAKDRAVETAYQAKDKAAETAYQAKDKVAETTGVGQGERSDKSWTDTAYSAKDNMVGTAYQAKDKAAEATGMGQRESSDRSWTQAAYDAKDKAVDTTYQAKDKAAEASHQAKDKAVETGYEAKDRAAETGYQAKDKSAEATGYSQPSSTSHLSPEILKAINDMNAGYGTYAMPTAGVPEPVSESIQRAHESPEAASNREAVSEKRDVERELMSKIAPTNATGEPAPTISESTAAPLTQETSHTAPEVPEVVAESIERARRSPEAAAYSEPVHEKAAVENELLHAVRPTDEAGEPAPAVSASTAAPLSAQTSHPAPEVPEVVAESFEEAHESPEAAAYSEPVHEKAAVEHELLKLVKPTEEAGEPAPTETAALSATAPGDGPAYSPPPPAEPQLATAAAYPTTMSIPPSGETELATAPPAPAPADPDTRAAAEATGLNAPAAAPAQSGATEIGQLAGERTPVDSRDVSPMSRHPTRAAAEPTAAADDAQQPMVTTGIGSASVPLTTGAPPATTGAGPPTTTTTTTGAGGGMPPSGGSSSNAAPAPVTPQKATTATTTPQRNVSQRYQDTPDSAKTSGSGASATDSKKSKRRSFFGKLKEKFKS